MDTIFVVFAGAHNFMVLVVHILAMMMKIHTIIHACIATLEAAIPHHFYLQLNLNPVLSPAALQFNCSFKDCKKKIHRPCFMAFIAKNISTTGRLVFWCESTPL
jgi:hypothetical protein